MNGNLIAMSPRDLMGEATSKRPTRERAVIVKSRIVHLAAACLLLPFGACGGGGGDTQQADRVVGTVAGPNGAKVFIPAGALPTEGDAISKSAGNASSGVAALHTVFVRADGSFFPPVTSIQEGDSVSFVGPLAIVGDIPGPGLGTTFSVVQTTRAELDLNVSCMETTRAYDITHDEPELDNELTGPLRRGSSGIFALGPEGATNAFEGVGTSCDAIAAAAGIAPTLSTERWDAEEGSATTICRKMDIVSGEATTTNSPHVMASTWDDPAIAGVVVRINWKDLYTTTLSADGATETIVPNYTVLDKELDNAARRGKQVFLEVLAGSGIPRWIFDDYVSTCTGVGCVVATETGIVPALVVPIKTSDFGTSSSTSMPTNNNCGYEKSMGSPADPAHRSAMLAMISKVADHVRASGLRYEALGSFKITGLNFLTGETRLPNRCLDPSQPNANGNSQLNCYCNTRIWATPLGDPVRAFEPADRSFPPPMVKGGGYTTEKAQKFLNEVENAIFVDFGRRKTMHYMLIQDGLPQVVDKTHYATEAAAVAPNLGYVDAIGAPIDGVQQTVDILANGRIGVFHELDGAGNPVSYAPDVAGALFSPMHAGLKWMPTDGSQCVQHQPTTVNAEGKDEASLRLPSTYPTTLSPANYGGPPCPNKWAVREGYEGQVMGFQTSNDVANPDQLSSALWNGTLNSNMVYLEAYEHTLWLARQATLSGATVLSTIAEGYADVSSRRKSLLAWSNELHKRRRTIASWTIAWGSQLC